MRTRYTLEDVLKFRVAGFRNKLDNWMYPLERCTKLTRSLIADPPIIILESENFKEEFCEHYYQPIVNKFKNAEMYLTQSKNEELGSLLVFWVATGNFVIMAGLRKINTNEREKSEARE